MLSDVKAFRVGNALIAAAVLAVAVVGSLSGWTREAGAAEPSPLAAKVAGSLDFVPSDVSFYSVSLRTKEQLDLVLESNAWKKLKSLPSVKSAWQQFESQWTDGPLAQFAALLQMPENEELISLLGDMSGSEVFMYGDQRLNDALDLMNEVNNASRLSTIAASIQAMKGNFNEGSAMLQSRAVLDTLADNLDILTMPTVVFGFKVKDATVASRQLKRLELLTKMALGQAPMFRSRFERKKIGEGDYLNFTLDGSLVPWEEYDLEHVAAEPGQYDALTEKLKAFTLAISLGTYKNYVLIGLSSSTDHLAALGAGETLARDGRLDIVGKFADQRLTGVAYISQELMARLQGTPDNTDNIKEMVEVLLEEADVDEELNNRVLKDVAALSADLKGFIPKPGELVSFSFLTPRGIESYAYDHSQNLALDGSRRLDLLEHIGGSPILASVTRGKVSVGQYKTLVKWVKVADGYFEDLALPAMKDQERERSEKFLKLFKPLAARFNSTTIDKLFPALADGQVAVVVDDKWSSKQWLQAAPETAKAMALPEPALVFGVTDPKLLRQAMSDYQNIADDGVVALRKAAPEVVPPDFKLPRPVKQTAGPGEAFVYKIPAEAGLDAQVAPNAALGDHTAVLSLSVAHSARLLASTPYKGAGALADTRQSLANAVVWNWADGVELASPWVLFGVKNYGAIAMQAAAGAAGLDNADDPDDKGAVKPEMEFDVEAVLPQVRDGLTIFKTLRTITSSLRIDETSGAMIRHTEFYFQDLP